MEVQPVALVPLSPFQLIKQARNLESIQTLVNQHVQARDLANWLCLSNGRKTLLTKIIKKALPFDTSPDLFQEIYRNLSPIRYPYLSKELRQVIREETDLSDDELRQLRSHLKYKRLLKQQPLDPDETIKYWSQEEIQCLSFPSPRSPFLYQLLHPYQEKKDPKNFVPIFNDQLGLCLRDAIQHRKTNIAIFLLEMGADVNALAENDLTTPHHISTIALGIDLLRVQPASLNLLKQLIETRQAPVVHEICEVLHYCCQNYKTGTDNQLLFDRMISLLLGYRIDTATLVRNDEMLLKYFAHNNDLAGIIARTRGTGAATRLERRFDLTGFFEYEYLQLRLRLLLEVVCVKMRENSSSSRELIQEFLIELEMAWIATLMQKWNSCHFSEPLTREFCQSIAIYISKQIDLLPRDSEFSIYTGWHRHAICVAFKRITENQIEIRIDNLGHKVNDYHHSTSLNTYQSRRLALCTGGVPREYIENLIYNFTTYGTTAGNELQAIRNVYEPSSLTILLRQNVPTYQEFNVQTVGNCVVASFHIGVKTRHETLFDEISQREMGLLTVLRTTSPQVPVAPAQFHPETFIESMRHSLRQYYKNFTEKHPSFMIPQFKPLGPQARNDAADSLCYEIDTALKNNLPYRTRIDGVAGMGKTLLSRFLSHWLTSRNNTVFLIPLRHLSDAAKYQEGRIYELIDLVEEEVFRPMLNRYLFPHEKILVQQHLQSGQIIWILDGLDELKARPGIQYVINALFEEKRVIITSRPGIQEDRITHYTLREIDDYSQNDIQIFIESSYRTLFLQHREEQTGDVTQFKLYQNSLQQALKYNENLRRLCRVPITLEKVCLLWFQGHHERLLTNNLAEINEHFAFHLLQTAFSREIQKGAQQEQLSVGLKPQFLDQRNVADYFRKATKLSQYLAFFSLKEERCTIFSEAIVALAFNRIKARDREAVRRNLKSIGVVKLDARGGEFVHASVQEFLTAQYLVKSLKQPGPRFEEAQSFIRQHRFKPEYQNVMEQLIYLLIYKTEKLHSKYPRGVLENVFDWLIEGVQATTLNRELFSHLLPLLHVFYQTMTTLDTLPSLKQKLVASVDQAWQFVKTEFIQKVVPVMNHQEWGKWAQEQRLFLLPLANLLSRFQSIGEQIGICAQLENILATSFDILINDWEACQHRCLMFTQLCQCTTPHFFHFLVSRKLIGKVFSSIEQVDIFFDYAIQLLQQQQAPENTLFYLSQSVANYFNQILDKQVSQAKFLKRIVDLLSTRQQVNPTQPLKIKIYDDCLQMFFSYSEMHGRKDYNPTFIQNLNELFDSDSSVVGFTQWSDLFRRIPVEQLINWCKNRLSYANVCDGEMRDQSFAQLGHCLGLTLSIIDRQDPEFGTTLLRTLEQINKTGNRVELDGTQAQRYLTEKTRGSVRYGARKALASYRAELSQNPQDIRLLLSRLQINPQITIQEAYRIMHFYAPLNNSPEINQILASCQEIVQKKPFGIRNPIDYGEKTGQGLRQNHE